MATAAALALLLAVCAASGQSITVTREAAAAPAPDGRWLLDCATLLNDSSLRRSALSLMEPDDVCGLSDGVFFGVAYAEDGAGVAPGTDNMPLVNRCWLFVPSLGTSPPSIPSAPPPMPPPPTTPMWPPLYRSGQAASGSTGCTAGLTGIVVAAIVAWATMTQA